MMQRDIYERRGGCTYRCAEGERGTSSLAIWCEGETEREGGCGKVQGKGGGRGSLTNSETTLPPCHEHAGLFVSVCD